MAIKTPPRGYGAEHVQKRREWLKAQTGRPVGVPSPESDANYQGIIENCVGVVPIPMAIAGPLVIDGTYAKGTYYVPLCTVEGTLSLSMTRGLMITAASGIQTEHIKQELSRSPVFRFASIRDIPKFLAWVREHTAELRSAAESTTSHGKLLRIDPYPIQDRVILDFVYSTAEAAGQNMVTIATHAACKYISECCKSPVVTSWELESNFSGDKKMTNRHALLGRGHSVIASCVISARRLKKLGRVTPRQLMVSTDEADVHCMLSGAVSTHAHLSNTLAAIYLATGQDAACVAENAVGTFDAHELEDGSARIMLTMPSITVGTVGGGTRLGPQRSNLESLGCTGENSSKKLAEIICACALALDLSLTASICSDEFASSHSEFGR